MLSLISEFLRTDLGCSIEFDLYEREAAELVDELHDLDCLVDVGFIASDGWQRVSDSWWNSFSEQDVLQNG